MVKMYVTEMPIYAYPVLFWYTLPLLRIDKKRREMQYELENNVIYKN